MKVVHRRSSTLAGCVALLALGTVVAAPARASTPEPPAPPPAEVSAAVHHDVSAPLWSLRAAPGTSARSYPAKPVRTGGATDSASGANVQPAAPTAPVAKAPATVRNFDGIGQGFTGPGGTFTIPGSPPDPIGAVGPNHYVQAVNSSFAVFNKSGVVLFGPAPLNTLWSGFGGDCQTHNDGDPTVQYDPIANRWLISQFAITPNSGVGPFLQCVAISTSPDPTGTYNRYSFFYATNFIDYPKFGVWPDGYYATFNVFNASGTAYLGAKVCAYDRARMLQGLSATQQCFNTTTDYGGLLAADLDGSRLPPNGAPEQVLGLGITDFSGNGSTLAAWKFHVDWATPANSTFTGPTTLTVANYQLPCNATYGDQCIPQSGTTQKLDSLGDRLMNRLAYRNFADGHQSLVVSHSITNGASVGERWYELRLDGANDSSIFQQGIYAPDTTFRWMGSIAQDGAGDIALGYSASSASIKPQIRYTGRLAGDPSGQMAQGEGTIIAGTGSQGLSLSRWGDYSQMDIDPVDDCTFWYTNQYLATDGTFNWKTRIASFKFPSCVPDFSISAAPPTVSVVSGSASTSTTISTGIVVGSAENVALTVTGVPSGATASLSPSSVVAGGSSTLTLDAGTAVPGTYTVTVTGTALSATRSTGVTFTITPAPDFAVSVTPSSASVVAGSSGSYTVTTSALNGSVQLISLSVTGLPAGALGSFSPASVVAGASATLTMSAATTAAPTTSTFTVTGTSGSTTHAKTADLTITPVPAPAGATRFVGLPPFRLLDTRVVGGITGGQPVAPGGQVDLQVTGAGGVPATNVAAVVLNVTAAGALAPGFVTVWPTSQPQPTASNLNVTAVGQNIANLVTVRLGNGGRVSLFSQSGSDLVVDVAGYYEPVTTTSRAGRYTPLSPTRILDSRIALGVPGTAPVAADSKIDVVVAGRGGVPATGVRAVVLNVTAAQSLGAGFVTVWPTGNARPNASTLNVTFAGQNIANLVIVPLGTDGSVSLYTQSGTHLVADVAGWFGDDTQQPGLSGMFIPVDPARVLDTRNAIGIATTSPVPPDTAVVLAIAGHGGAPAAGVGAVVLNVTAAAATAPGYITVWPSDQPQPTASNLNVTAVGQNIPNLVSVSVSAGGAVSLYTQSGTHLLADLAGYYVR